jgi:hypothetical protein
MPTPDQPTLRSLRWLPAAALALALPLASAQTAPPPPAAPASEDIIVLSPFQVTAAQETGYFAENTLAGSRLNTNVGDLAASISVVTRQQLDDTGALDINDIFLYEANTEGANNYTPLIYNRGWVKDQIAGHSQDSGEARTVATANRVRGLSPADTSYNYYPTIARLPFDAYNTQSVEISRGPNSLLFGLGSPSGIVNQTGAQAILNRNSNEVQLRYGSFDSFRSSLALNRSLIEDRLAIYVAALYDERGFQRKPSYDITRRQFGALTLRPTNNTLIRASAEGYHNSNRRPNSLTPRDAITPWFQAGRPAYDPVNRTVTIQDTGQVVGPYVLTNLSPGWIPGTATNDSALNNPASPIYVPGINWVDYGRPAMYIDQGEFRWLQRQPNTNVAGVYPLPSQAQRLADGTQVIFERRWTSSATLPGPANIATWYAPGITNKSLYNWEKINLTAANFGKMQAGTYNIEFEQRLLSNLFFSAGWFRQQLDTRENYTISQQQATTVFIDSNSRLPDGSPNPNFGRPYIEDFQADTFQNPENNDNLRAMLAYDLDFTQRDGWTRWLGRHRLLGLWSEQDLVAARARARASIIGGDIRYMPNPLPNPNWNFPQNNGSIRRYYYLGDNDGRITQSSGSFGNPGEGGPTTATIRTYNWQTGQWDEAPVQMGTELFHAGTFKTQRNIQSLNFAVQSYLWDNRIVSTIGFRRDDYKARSTTQAGLTNADMYEDGRLRDIEFLWNRWGNWEKLSGNTSTAGVVFKPLRWSTGELSLHYNQSDNFNPPTGAQTDIFGRALPKPVGDGKDYGIGVSLFENKLVARLNWFETENKFERNGTSATLMARTVRMDQTNFRNWAELVVRIRSGEDPLDPLFADATQRPLSTAQQEQVAQIMGLPYDWPAGLTIGSTQTNRAEGLELQLTYNPMRNWTMKVTAGKQETAYAGVVPEWDEWIGNRMPVWMAASAPDMPELTQFRGGRNLSLRNFWNGYGYNTDVTELNNFGWTNTANFYDLVVGSEVALAKQQEGLVSPGQRKWRGSFLTNYTVDRGPFKNVSVGGSVRWQDKAAIGYFGLPSDDGIMRRSDPSRPIFDKGLTNVDVWVSYTRPIFAERIRMKVQLNVRDAFESGGLQTVAVNWDGTPYAYRIKDPRTFFLTTTFSF